MRLIVALLAITSLPAQARIVRVDIIAETPFAAGATFGTAGPYTRIDAVAHGVLDPADPALAAIALLAQAPRNAQGLVEYDTDVTILRPARPSGVLLVDIPNRGNKYVPSWIDDAPETRGMVNDPRSLADAGLAYTFRRGMTLAWVGWQPEVRGPGLMALRIPTVPGVIQRIRHEFQLGTRGPDNLLRIALPYPVASTDTARLTHRAREQDSRDTIPRDAWGFVDSRSIQLLPFGTRATPGHIYEFTYDATNPTPTGIGFAATRDVVAYLRKEPGITHTIGFGVSLSGRFLRHFLDLGMNQGPDGTRVFDGVLAHIAGAGRVFANHPFAMPGRTATQHEDRFYPEIWPPHDVLHHPDTDPVLIESNTSTEYWQKGASLIQAAPDPRARAYLIPGTQHGGHSATAATAGLCAAPRNPHSAGPALRAMLANLEAWVVDGTPPPPSRVPRAGNETGVAASAVRMPAVPGVRWATRGNPIGAPTDWTEPTADIDTLPTIVSAVDIDGNEVAGIPLPHVTVPLGTSTGTNLYRDLPDELCDRDGMFVPFARTRAAREQTGDPRLSLEERYKSEKNYASDVRSAVEWLVVSGQLLREDAERIVARARW